MRHILQHAHTSRHERWLRDKTISLLVRVGIEKAPDMPLINGLAKEKERIQILKLTLAEFYPTPQQIAAKAPRAVAEN